MFVIYEDENEDDDDEEEGEEDDKEGREDGASASDGDISDDDDHRNDCSLTTRELIRLEFNVQSEKRLDATTFRLFGTTEPRKSFRVRMGGPGDVYFVYLLKHGAIISYQDEIVKQLHGKRFISMVQRRVVHSPFMRWLIIGICSIVIQKLDANMV